MKIVPCPPFATDAEDLFLLAIQELVSRIIPQPIQEEMERGSIHNLLKSLPLLSSSPVSNSSWVTLLCPSKYTSGVGRYFNDALCRWLVPGKNLPIPGSSSLNFSFASFPHHQFYVQHTLLQIDSSQELAIATRNHPRLLEEIRLNVLAVYQTRYVASLRSISLEQKQLLIEQNLSKILNLSSTEDDPSPFDEMHHFLMNISGEEKMNQVKQTIDQLIRARPKSFDRETFYEMTQFMVLFKRQFASTRSARHVTRVIALQYVFKKMLLNASETKVHCKVFTSGLPKDVLGILMALNVWESPNSLLSDAVQLCIPNCTIVPDSVHVDRRDQKVSLLYIEVHKPSGFLPQEIQQLRLALPHHAIQLLENQQIFLPRNEEDLARNLIALSQQIKSMTSLPQVTIHYEKQTESQVLFSVLLSRLLFQETKNLREILVQWPHWSIDEMRLIGKLKHKVPKEAALLRVCLDKAPFMRANFSADLLCARQKIAAELTQILGPYRDFNGGIIAKQEEALLALRTKLDSPTPETEHLLESYFYSLRPGIMRTILPTEVLHAHFLQLKALQSTSLCEETLNGFFILFARATSKDRLDMAVEKLRLPTHELMSAFLRLPQFMAAGYVLRTENMNSIDALRTSVNDNRFADIAKGPVHKLLASV